jgi:hypothetical protein
VSAGFPSAGGPSGPGAPPDMRASDADRDRVIDVLRAAAGDGRLTAEEFGERMQAALSSRTHGQLAVLTADLVAAPAMVTAQAAPAPQAAHVPEVIRIDQRGGSVRRTGRWLVPARLELRSSWCDVTLDLTNAVITHPGLRIDVQMRGGTLILVTGPGMTVDADSLTVRYTDVDIRPATEPGLSPAFRVQLAGRMRYGRIEAHHPRPPATQ